MKKTADKKGKGWSFVDDGKGVVWLSKGKTKTTKKATKKRK